MQHAICLKLSAAVAILFVGASLALAQASTGPNTRTQQVPTGPGGAAGK